MTSRVRWEGMDDTNQSKGGALCAPPSEVDGAVKHSRKKKSIDFICTAVKNLSHHSTSSSAKANDVICSPKTACVCDANANVEIPGKYPVSRESQERILVERIEPVAEDAANMEQESLLETTKEKQFEEVNRNLVRNKITLDSKQPLPTINDRTSWPAFSGQVTPMLQKNYSGEMVKPWKQHARQATVDILSALYGIMLVVMGVAFPTSQVISSKIPSHYYEGFYTYLYFISIGFFCYIYILLKTQFIFSLTWKRRKFMLFFLTSLSSCYIIFYHVIGWYQLMQRLKAKTRAKVEATDDNVFQDDTLSMEDITTSKLRVALSKELDFRRSANHGSFYLRMGAVVFGVGSMIYSGLEFAQYFEMSSDPLCDDIMMAVQPASRMLFTFFQMYFVFLNAKIKIIKNSNVIVARFGMMHIIATNLCIWLNVIIQETKHEILHFKQYSSGQIIGQHLGFGHSEVPVQLAADEHSPHASTAIVPWLNETVAAVLLAGHSEIHQHRLVKRTLSDECHRSELMGTLMQNASPFLFPCAIEYSLICAAIMYEIWKHTGEMDHHHRPARSMADSPSGGRTPRTPSGSYLPFSQRRSPHHYSVDCTNANKGLFFGIFVLVLSILSMILFFVLIHRDDHKEVAITIIDVTELILYIMTLVAVLIGMIQVSQLQFDASRPLDLDNILLIVALTGVMSYNVFTIVGTQFSDHPGRMLVLANALAAILQAVTQTLFLLGSSKRHLYTRRQEQRKPGRQVVTFLMVTNFAMWAIITLEKSRFDAHPVQTQFFGQWPWTIITNISSPLAIFYRYHSTVCLCEIWKRCYKVPDRLNNLSLQQNESV